MNFFYEITALPSNNICQNVCNNVCPGSQFLHSNKIFLLIPTENIQGSILAHLIFVKWFFLKLICNFIKIYLLQNIQRIGVLLPSGV